MKKITLTFFLLLFAIGFSQNAPISFESGENGSTWSFASFENGGGLGYEKVVNPFKTGINTSGTVGKFTALSTAAGAAPYAGCESAHASGVNGIGSFTFSLSNCIVKVMVYKPIISDVGIKFAESNGEAQPEVKVKNTKINEWEELTFDMSGSIGKGATGIIDQIIVFPDFQARTTENVCYFDNITFSAKSGTTGGSTTSTAPTLPMDFESSTIAYSFVGFDGGAVTKIANPHNTGINTSATVAQMVKGAGQPWAGAKIVMASAVDFSTKKLIKIKVWSPVAGKKLLLKFEGAGAAFEKESVGVTAANAWQELSFDFTGVAGVNNLNDNIVFIFDLGTAGDGSATSTYLFDDVIQSAVSGGGTTPTPTTAAPYAPVTFESGEYGSTWSLASFENGGGVGYEKVVNPFKTGINTSGTVGKFTALTTAAGAAPWAGCESAHASGVNGIGSFTFSLSNCIVKVMVYKPIISDVGIKFAESNGEAQPEVKVKNTKINEWEELTFDMSGSIGKGATGIIDQIIVFPDFQARTTENVCYFDNITFSAKSGTTGGSTTSTAPTLPMDFESSTIAYSFVGFDGGAVTKIANPHNTGINTSATVAQMVKGAGQPWAGAKIVMASAVDFSTKKLIKIKVWSPVAGKKLLLKFEGAGAAFEKESVGVTAANAWQELSFDFTGVAGVNNLNDNIVFIFDLGTAGDGSATSTYLFDDVIQSAVSGGGTSLTQMSLPVTFDSATVDYGLIGFGGAEASTVVVDPTLSTNKVAKVVKSAAAELWAGTTISAAAGLGFSSAIPFTASATKMNVRVWSPTAGIKVRLKVEDHNDNTHTVETEATVTTASGWQTLEFNFANQATGTAALNLAFVYDKASIFFNFGVTGATAGEKTYYFDDVAFGAAPTTGTSTAPTLPMDFESSTIAYSFVGFDGGAVTKIANPHNTGINTSATVAQMVKGAGQPWAGAKIVMASAVDFSTKKLIKIKVWSPVAGKKLLLKFEGAGAAFEKESVGVTAANAWQELSFDFTGVAGVNNLNDNIVFIFDLGTAGDGSATSTYLFDDVIQSAVSGGGTSLTQMSLPVTFDSATVDYGLIGFGGAEASTVVVDPTLSTNKVAKVVKSAAAELWAGTTISAAAGLGFSSAIPFTASATKMNVRVWSPTAGIKVRLKVEDHNDNTHTVETEATVTTASGWQTLEFNFANQVAGTAALNLAFVYDKASIFFNFGVTGATAGEKTYYFDDLAFGAAPITGPITMAPTNLNYGGNLRFEINKDIKSVTPTVTADPLPTYSISPILPKGLSFDAPSGSIAGKPTVETGPVSYTVTATNSVGSQKLTFTIEIFNNDHDFDGINDDVDNCPEFYNPNQEDKNNDGIGDICIEEEQVKVAQGFSPNGDGINDTWFIKNIENYPNTQVRVFNKTAAEVFFSRDYKNLWDGTYKNTGEIVAAGSYFYQVDLGGDGSIDLQGWIYIAN